LSPHKLVTCIFQETPAQSKRFCSQSCSGKAFQGTLLQCVLQLGCGTLTNMCRPRFLLFFHLAIVRITDHFAVDARGHCPRQQRADLTHVACAKRALQHFRHVLLTKLILILSWRGRTSRANNLTLLIDVRLGAGWLKTLVALDAETCAISNMSRGVSDCASAHLSLQRSEIPLEAIHRDLLPAAFERNCDKPTVNQLDGGPCPRASVSQDFDVLPDVVIIRLNNFCAIRLLSCNGWTAGVGICANSFVEGHYW
jgi:hypothetical protein